ncbi:restriction endonuclease S subunit [Variovorax paradoxus]|uniref:Restriction endonuclease S subunit n=1 Tax=Variovorax paradoxus TaxID=34073 RepID=A0AAE3Y1D3_VARPD|nr:restriction endonuclease S subunit [Variovorax paradoxus]MDR6428799.1 restriction endonuclease S subunit [Variovorax paradoxus]
MTAAGLAACGATLLPKGTVLFSSRAPIGYVAIAANDISTNQGFKSFVLPEGFDSRYCYYQLKYLRPQAEMVATGTTFKELSGAVAATLPFKIAPLNEQTRIADQLDTLLARIQACIDRLDAIPALLKRFRQAVLEAALSGQATDDWREAESSSLEGWKPATISDIAVVGTGSTPLRSNGNFFSKSGTPWVTSAATSRAYVDTADEFVTPAAISAHRLKIYAPGTLLVAMYGEGKTRGQVSELRIHAAINQACAAISVDRRKASTEFVKLALLAQYEQMRALAEGGNQPNLNLSKVKGIPVLLPPEREQAEIVRRVKALFALADRIEARHAAAVAHVQRLTSLTLAKAFRGELVQQDVNDEPASVLLQRIAKTPAPAVKTQRGRPRPQQPREFTALPAMQPDGVAFPAGAWAASGQLDEHATTAQLIAVLKAWGEPMPQDQVRLAAVLCLQPRLFTAALPAQDAASWRRLVGAEAEPLPASMAVLQPAVNTHWRRALAGLRSRGDLVVSGAGPQDTWALGPGADRVDTAGWPDGRAGWVAAYLRARGVAALLPLLSPAAVDFVHARAA